MGSLAQSFIKTKREFLKIHCCCRVERLFMANLPEGEPSNPNATVTFRLCKGPHSLHLYSKIYSPAMGLPSRKTPK